MNEGKKPQIVLFIDWDETITSHDTLSLIAPPDDQHEGVPFAEYGKQYVEDLKRHENTWQYSSQQSTTNNAIGIPRKECNLGTGWQEYWAYQNSLDSIELASQKRIEEGGLFRNCDPKEIEHRAIDKVQFRKGWPEIHFFHRLHPNIWGSYQTTEEDSISPHMQRLERLLDEASKSSWQYHIISVGWSARFITAALKRVNKNRSMPSSICANEIEIDPKTGLGTGKLTKSYDAQKLAQQAFLPGEGGIRTGQHKVREMRRILQTYPSDSNLISIYVGDSTTDLGSLIEAHIGLIIGQSTSLYNTIIKAGLEKFKVNCSDGKIREIIAAQVAENKQPCLIKVNDWKDVGEVLKIINECITPPE